MQAILPQRLFSSSFNREKAVSLTASIVVNLAMIAAFASIANIDGDRIKEGASLVVVGLSGSESESDPAEAKQAASLPAPPPAAPPAPSSVTPDAAEKQEPIDQKIALLHPLEPVPEHTDGAPAKTPAESQPSPDQMRQAAELQQRSAQEAARARAVEPAPSEAKATASDNAAARSSARSGGGANYGGVVIQHLRRFTRSNSVGAGATLVRIAIDGGGNLQDAGIIRSSGSASFDREALQTVRRASPFPRPPAGEGRTINFEFTGR